VGLGAIRTRIGRSLFVAIMSHFTTDFRAFLIAKIKRRATVSNPMSDSCIRLSVYNEKILMAQSSSRLKKSLPFIAIGTSLLYIVVLFVTNATLIGSLWIVLGILLTILMAIVAVIAGMAVIKALFVVAAELSLLIFLAQAYCGVPIRMPQNDAALKSLFTVGILYIGFIFLQSLWEILKGHYNRVHGEGFRFERVVTTLAYVVFVGLFLWQLYLVVSPIVINLCVYK